MKTDEIKKLIDGLTFLVNTSAKAPAEKQTHVICEAIFNDLKKLIESLESKPESSESSELRVEPKNN